MRTESSNGRNSGDSTFQFRGRTATGCFEILSKMPFSQSFLINISCSVAKIYILKYIKYILYFKKLSSLEIINKYNSCCPTKNYWKKKTRDSLGLGLWRFTLFLIFKIILRQLSLGNSGWPWTHDPHTSVSESWDTGVCPQRLTTKFISSSSLAKAISIFPKVSATFRMASIH